MIYDFRFAISKMVGRTLRAALINFSFAFLCALLFTPVTQAQNTTVTAIITVTNTFTTNGQTLTLYLNGGSAQTYTWTNVGVAGVREIKCTNPATKAATNLFLKLSADFTNKLLVTYSSSTAVKLQTYLNGGLHGTVFSNWGTISLTTNAIINNTTIVASNFLSYNATVSNQLTVLGTMAVSNISATNIVSSNNITAYGTNFANYALVTNNLTVGGYTIASNLTASRALVSGAEKQITNSTVTTTELAHVSGVTAPIQGQINDKIATTDGIATNTLTVKGNLIVNTNGNFGGYITATNLTAGRALVSGAEKQITNATATTAEVNLLSGKNSVIDGSGADTQVAIFTAAGRVTGHSSFVYSTATGVADLSRLRVGNGTPSEPSLAFSGDTDTGFYTPGANAATLIIGGATNLAFTSSAITSAVPVLLPDGSASAPSWSNVGDEDTGLFFSGADQIGFSTGNSERVRMRTGDFLLSSAIALGWGSSGVSTPDLFLIRDAANTFALRNGTTAQLLRVYNTFTDASNYERGLLEWSGNVLFIGATNAGTGSARVVRIQSPTLLQLRANNAAAWEITTGAALVPDADNTTAIGAASQRPTFVNLSRGIRSGTTTAFSGVFLTNSLGVGIMEGTGANYTNLVALNYYGSGMTISNDAVVSGTLFGVTGNFASELQCNSYKNDTGFISLLFDGEEATGDGWTFSIESTPLFEIEKIGAGTTVDGIKLLPKLLGASSTNTIGTSAEAWTYAYITNIISGLNTFTSSAFNKTDTTLANVTGLTAELVAGRTYAFRAVLNVDADTTGGHKYAIAGTATATAIEYQINALKNATFTNTISSRLTALGGSAGEASGTAYQTIIEGTITVNAAGTLTVQFAQNAASGTSTVRALSRFMVTALN